MLDDVYCEYTEICTENTGEVLRDRNVMRYVK